MVLLVPSTFRGPTVPGSRFHGCSYRFCTGKLQSSPGAKAQLKKQRRARHLLGFQFLEVGEFGESVFFGVGS